MRSSEIRDRFLRYFERNGHVVRPSSSLVPADDPTLLFTNAGMVQFKRVFLGLEESGFGQRAVTSQKCVRAGGKHNDLEQVGHTARHNTFFEMLGNFSFGDYFKREAIRFGWEFVTKELGIDPRHVRVTVYHKDSEARELWKSETGMSDSRIYGLGERDNFWQMADTGPCGPCSEIYLDLAALTDDFEFPEGATGEWTDLEREEFSHDGFVEGAEAGRFLEIWNLVFMQFDRQGDGELVPLPRPSVDTGAGLDRITAVMQGVVSNFHTDLFRPLIEVVEEVTGLEYPDAPPVWKRSGSRGRKTSPSTAGSFRVLADHGRAVAFLLADGVFPSNEGRGYVLRRILRRAVRHAWLLGRKTEPTLVHVVQRVIAEMSGQYPELKRGEAHLLQTTQAEEERFLATIEEGMTRFDQIAPAASTQGSSTLRGTISGEDAFRLYDTFGFPIDLTQLIARERGYTVDISGFNRALNQQREQSKEDRRSRKVSGPVADELSDAEAWDMGPGRAESLRGGEFVGYERVQIETEVTAIRQLGEGRVAVLLLETPFYAESGGQVSDRGSIEGDGWRVQVDEVRKFDGKVAAIGTLEGNFAFGRAIASVPTMRRKDTERNHTATHLLHSALRELLGEHVHQAGSLVEPDRLRFDFTHHGPLGQEMLDAIEKRVNEGIWSAVELRFEQRAYAEAVKSGAMALFGEKYGDVVRVVTVPGISVELCGGTHVRNTSEIGLFRIVGETGIAAGQRRIEAVTGGAAFNYMRSHERMLDGLAELLKAPVDAVERRVQALLEERKSMERRMEELRASGGDDRVRTLLAAAQQVGGVSVAAGQVAAMDARDLQSVGDQLREQLGSGVGLVGAAVGDGKHALLAVVTDDLRERGLRADDVVRAVAALGGGRGGGKAHMAQAGLPDAQGLSSALTGAGEVLLGLVKSLG